MTKYLYILMCLTLPLAVHAANLSVQEDGGGDYQTLDEACDNIGAGETITIEGEWDNPDTRSVIVSTDCTITATGSARVTTASHVSGTPKHYRLHVSDGEHAITVNDSETTIDGIEIKQAGSGSSDECIRFAHEGGTLNVSDCILYSGLAASDQDGIYAARINCTVNIENVIAYNFLRAAIHAQPTSGTAVEQTWNINSCSIYNCSEDGEAEGGAISAYGVYAHTVNVNVHNTWGLGCNNDASDTYNETINLGTVNWGISYSIDDDNSIASRDAGGAGNQASRVISDSDEGEGSYVIVNDITDAAPFDLSLTDLTNAKNNAQDEHATEQAESLSIPGTDIDGTTRPDNTNYEVGAYEIDSGGEPPSTAPQFIRIVQSGLGASFLGIVIFTLTFYWIGGRDGKTQR